MNTEEKYTSSPQVGVPGHCSMAQVWDLNGKNLAVIDPTEDAQVATETALRIAEALNALIDIPTESFADLKRMCAPGGGWHEHLTYMRNMEAELASYKEPRTTKEKLEALSIADLKVLSVECNPSERYIKDQYDYSHWDEAHKLVLEELNSRITDIFGPINQ